MTGWSSRMRRSAVLAVPIAALLAATGGTPAVASPAHAVLAAEHTGTMQAHPATGFTWHKLHLINGWVSASTSYLNTGAPEYAVHKGVVYLSGALSKLASSPSDNFATLPPGARPAHWLFIQVYTNNGVEGTLEIRPDGTMHSFYGGSGSFTASLAAVSFPTAAIKSHRLTLQNGWQSSESTYLSGDPSAAIGGGIVYLSGALNRTVAGSRQFAVLPRADRPAHVLRILDYAFGGTTGWLTIEPDGAIFAYGAQATSFTSLAGISYPVASTRWHKLHLTAGWAAAKGAYQSAAPSYAVVAGVVYLTGGMREVRGMTGTVGQLAKAEQPVHRLYFGTYVGSGSFGTMGMAGSLILVTSKPFKLAMTFTSFAGISYPQHS